MKPKPSYEGRNPTHLLLDEVCLVLGAHIRWTDGVLSQADAPTARAARNLGLLAFPSCVEVALVVHRQLIPSQLSYNVVESVRFVLVAVAVAAAGLPCLMNCTGNRINMPIHGQKPVLPELPTFLLGVWLSATDAQHEYQQQLDHSRDVLAKLWADNGEFSVQSSGDVQQVIAPLIVGPSHEIRTLPHGKNDSHVRLQKKQSCRQTMK